MRIIAFLLITSWISGLAIGAWQVSFWLLLLAAAGWAVAAWRTTRALPLSCACFILVGVAAVYAWPYSEAVAVCSPAGETQGSIIAPPQLSSRSARYTVLLANPPCTVLVSASRFPVFALGDTLSLHGGTLQHLDDIAQENPGYARFLAHQNVALVWRYPEVARVQATDALRAAVHTTVAHAIARSFVEPDASIVHALVLADDSAIPQHLEENFKATGLTHLLAISGMNISLWAAILLLIFTPLHLPLLVRGVIITAVLWAYMYVLDWPISAVRATLFWSLALFAAQLRVLVSLPTVLLLTVFLLTSLRPDFFVDVGFQLSVAAVVGILLATFLARPALHRVHNVWHLAAGALLVTTGATVATWPIIAYHFHTVSLLSILANAFVAPVVGVQMLSAALTLVLSIVSPAAALVPSFVTHLTVEWMDVISSSLAALPGNVLEDVALPAWAGAVYYATLVLGMHWWLHYQGRSWREIWQ